MFNRVTAVVLFVQDFEKCLAFYRDQVGLTVAQLETKFATFKFHEQNFAINGIAEGAAMVGLEAGAFYAEAGKSIPVMLCTRVENVDEVYETLKGRGVEFTESPKDQYWGLRTAFFRDPEGNIWEIATPIKKDN
jgi:uncharacterized glyoxalase superfamily protein PhnB